MTPSARIQAAAECLDQILGGDPAEKTLTNWARRSRYAGSKDRAAVRDHVFDALRCRDSYAARGGALTGRGLMLGMVLEQGLSVEEIFAGQGHGATALSDEELECVSRPKDGAQLWNMPAICADKLRSAYPETALQIAEALCERAPVDLRVNARKARVTDARDALAAEGIVTEPVAIASLGLRVLESARRVKLSQPYLNGSVELQDAGSQALVEALPLQDGMRVLDFCAGGGGKSLAMAATSDLTILAHDINAKRMTDIPDRAQRAGVAIECISTDRLEQIGQFDAVLCDAPCSGSGSWRRNPDAKWRFDEEQFSSLLTVQADILKRAAGLVAPQGFLAYATCSLFAEENEHQINEFLENAVNFQEIATSRWTPLDGCDGFYLSVLRKS